MDEIKVLVIGDPHVRVKEIHFSQLMLDEVVTVAKKELPDFIVVLGDILDTHNRVEIGPLTRAIDWLAELKDISPLYVLVGNHDIRNNHVNLCREKLKEHSLTALRHWPRTVLVEDVTVFDIKGFHFLATPFVPEGEYHETVKHLKLGDFNACFSHNNFKGVKYRLDEAPADCPDVWPEDAPPMFAGHNHEYQVVRPNLVYIGTPGQQDFGANPDKAIALITFNQTAPYDMRRIQLITIPIRMVFSSLASDLIRLDTILKHIIQLKSSRDLVLAKVKVDGTRAELNTFAKSLIYKEMSAINDLKIDQIPVDEGVEKPIYEVINNPSVSFEDHMRKLLHGDPYLLETFNKLID
jgi:DNA repair exonuclease SbcCD nuclease subunit